MNLKTYNVDIDDPSALKKLIKILIGRRLFLLKNLGYNEVQFFGNKGNVDNIFPVFDAIIDCDLSLLYLENYNLQQKYYVYFHCNPCKPLQVTKDIRHLFLATKFGLGFEPFYVGKGIDSRYLDFNRNDSHRKIRSKILKNGKEIVPVKIKDNLDEQKALILESKLIDILGLKAYSNYGLLVNLDEGMNATERRRLYPKIKYMDSLLKKNGFTI